MKGTPNTEVVYQNDFHHPAVDTAAVVTLAAVAGVIHVLDWIYWSYDAALAGKELLIVTIDGSTAFGIDIPISAAGEPLDPEPIHFPKGLYKEPNQALVVTLTAAGAAVKGKLNVGYH